jgi:Lon-like ATP-dependent protease
VQSVLEAEHLRERLALVLTLLRRELEAAELHMKIRSEVESKMNKQQREYMLREQLKVIKKELGMEKDDREVLIEKYKQRLQSPGLAVSEEINKVIEEEMNKLTTLDKSQSEFNITKTYLDWLTSMPWGRVTQEEFEISKVHEILNRDHFGMEKVKTRIKEFVAVQKLLVAAPPVGQSRESARGKILLLVGPPGVGKTSIARSVAESLNREYSRIALGGMYDVAELRGHRRTYVGAMPGKLVQALKQSKSMNPVIVLDEVDKVGSATGRGGGGEVSSALLEVLDPSQNGAFMDYYLDVPVDLSKALFICTANTLDTIPGPLLDRMEIIELSGYDMQEKIAIAQKYLIPKVLRSSGLGATPEDMKVTFTEDAVKMLINGYCREAGVRALEQAVERVVRKIALKQVTDDTERTWVVEASEVADYMGKAPIPSEVLYGDSVPPGVVMGLAWTGMGGSALYVEAVTLPSVETPAVPAVPGGSAGLTRIEVTGRLGAVMTESAKIATAVARRALHGVDAGNAFFVKEFVQMHFPEGATPKDGPSAGVTMASALYSLATGIPVPRDVAMTGELSLTGLVLPVGGIKEKVIAAKRAGARKVLLPDGNRRDVVDLPEYLVKDLEIAFCKNFQDVRNNLWPAKDSVI